MLAIGRIRSMKHRTTIAALALVAALGGGSVINTFENEAHPQAWIAVLGYAVGALLVLFVVLVVAGLAALVRRTFEDARRLRH
jgi:TRAP-type C4-dicarboxylate transport system permease small subunit